ncbi:F0F1 ATP synthase subunit delta [Pseudoroseomonas cervicalis]
MASEATNVSPNATQPSGLAQRYALALLELAKDKKTVDAVAAELEKLGALLAEDAAFRAFIHDPRLDSSAQQRAAPSPCWSAPACPAMCATWWAC